MNQNTNYSTLKLYKTDILTIDKNSMFSANANVSNFVAYLNTCWKETIDYFQYQKSLGMNLTIKFNVHPENIINPKAIINIIETFWFRFAWPSKFFETMK